MCEDAMTTLYGTCSATGVCKAQLEIQQRGSSSISRGEQGQQSRGTLFRPGFEEYVGIHHLDRKWENIPGREKAMNKDKAT